MLLSLYHNGMPAFFTSSEPTRSVSTGEDYLTTPCVLATLLCITTASPVAKENFLSRQPGDLNEIIRGQKGHLLSETPDEVVALFLENGRYSSAYSAIATALLLLEEVMKRSARWTAVDQPAIRMGIGLNTGQVSWQSETHTLQPGHTPSMHVLELARQLSRLNQQTPFPAAFMSHATFNAMRPEKQWYVEHLGMMQMSEQEQAQHIHAVMPAAQITQMSLVTS